MITKKYIVRIDYEPLVSCNLKNFFKFIDKMDNKYCVCTETFSGNFACGPYIQVELDDWCDAKALYDEVARYITEEGWKIIE